VSIESAGAFVAVTFDGAGGGEGEGVGRGDNEPVGSAAFGNCGAADAGAGVMLGAALGMALGAAGWVAFDGEAVMGCAAGAVAAGSAFCLPPSLPPGAAPGIAPEIALEAAFGAVIGAVLGTGATSGVGPVVAASDASALPEGCADPLCGGAGAVGSAGLCDGAAVSSAGRLS
jgi:hypothetical protein